MITRLIINTTYRPPFQSIMSIINEKKIGETLIEEPVVKESAKSFHDIIGSTDEITYKPIDKFDGSVEL